MAIFKQGSNLQTPDELIQVNDEYYAVYLYTATSGNVLPLVVSVDLPQSFEEGALEQAQPYTLQEYTDKYGYAFFPMFNLSDLSQIDPENPSTDIDFILDNIENDLEKKATIFGKEWYKDDEVQQLFAYGAITGEDISPYLENLTWFKDHSDKERDWIRLVYTNPTKAAEQVKANYTALKLQTAALNISGEGLDDLLRQLAAEVAQGKIDSAEAANTLSYLIDPYRLSMAGGSSAMNQDYVGFIDRINPTQSGRADAKNLVSQYLGVDAAVAFESNGVIEQYSAMLRADAQAGEGVTTNREIIENQLQAAHDKMFPNYEGSKHSLWSQPLYRTAQRVLGKAALSNADKKDIDIISQSVGGDMTLFAGELRKKFEDDPTYQDTVLGAMTGAFKQDISGVFSGQSLVGR
jgi:hypothetical protein